MNILKMNRSDDNQKQKKVSNRNIDENQTICRPTLDSYVIHYSILTILIFYFQYF